MDGKIWTGGVMNMENDVKVLKKTRELDSDVVGCEPTQGFSI